MARFLASRLILLVAFCLFAAFANFASEARADIMLNSTSSLQYEAPQESAEDKDAPMFWASQNAGNVIALVRKPDLAEGEFVLRFTTADSINSCQEFTGYDYLTNYRFQILEVGITPLSIAPPKGNQACIKKPVTPASDLVLNRTELLEKDITTVSLYYGTDRNQFVLTLNDSFVSLDPDPLHKARLELFTPQSLSMRQDSLLFWFYPQNTYLIWAPDLEYDRNYAATLDDYIQKNGLKRLSDEIRGFESPLNDKRFVYVVDANDRFKRESIRAERLENGFEIGHMSMTKEEYGLHGPKTVTTKISVLAKIPGLYD
jgi:hypothetical protein